MSPSKHSSRYHARGNSHQPYKRSASAKPGKVQGGTKRGHWQHHGRGGWKENQRHNCSSYVERSGNGERHYYGPQPDAWHHNHRNVRVVGNVGWNGNRGTVVERSGEKHYSNSSRNQHGAGHHNHCNGHGVQLKSRMNECNSVEEVLQQASMEIGSGSMRLGTLGATWSRISKLLKQHPREQPANESVSMLKEQIYGIVLHTLKSSGSFQPRDSSTITLGLAKIVNSGCEKTQPRRGALYHQLLTNALVAVETINHGDSIFQSLAEVTNRTLERFDARCLSNLVYAYALVGQNPVLKDGKTLFQNIASVVPRKVHTFDPQSLSNTAWSFASLGVIHPDLFQCIGDSIKIKPDLHSFKPQEFANIVNSFAKAGVMHADMFRKIGDAVVTRDLSRFKPQELSNLVHAYAKAGVLHYGLFRSIGDFLFQHALLQKFNPQNHANIVWAYATAGEAHPALFRKMSDAIVEWDLIVFIPQELSNIAWAYATAGEANPALFEKIGHAVVSRDLHLFNPQALSNIVWAYATVNELHLALFNKIHDTIMKQNNWKSFSNQQLANMAWSFAVADTTAPFFNPTFAKALIESIDVLTDIDLRQLHQWHLWLKEKEASFDLPISLTDRCYQSFTSAETNTSALQSNVVRVLQSMNLNPLDEYVTESGYSIDALVEINGRKIGVEVDGPSHFIEKKPKGQTLLKRRQVEALDNVQVVSVPFWEWYELGNNFKKKRQYLRSLLGV